MSQQVDLTALDPQHQANPHTAHRKPLCPSMVQNANPKPKSWKNPQLLDTDQRASLLTKQHLRLSSRGCTKGPR